MRKKMRVCDFFCGAGGFSEGFRQSGFEVVFALDNWKPAIDTHELNHHRCNSVLMNILELDSPKKIDEIVPDTEIIIGSPPCISFSNSNKSGKADKTLGLSLINAFLRIVAWKKKKGILKYWIMENVPNSSKYTKEIYTWKELGLPGKGPNLSVPIRKILNSANYGVPQSRDRFICGDFPIPNVKNEPENYLSTGLVLKNLGNPLVFKKIKIKDPVYNFKIDSEYLTDHFYDNRVAKFEWSRAKELKEDHGFMGKMSFPEDVNRPSRTVMATMSPSTRESLIFSSFDKNGRRNGYRLPTVREAACFMSFPITYQFEGNSDSIKYRLVGNAVCPKLSLALAEELLKKEKTKIKKEKSFIFKNPGFNLNGSKRAIKKPKLRIYNARFTHHVPYLKIRNYRVSIENIKSDFDSGLIKWEAVLHHGTGKDAKRLVIGPKISNNLSLGVPGIRYFHSDLLRIFNKYRYNHKSLHEDYILNDANKGPRAILNEIRQQIDKYFPEKNCNNHEIKHRERGVEIGNGSMPIRIVAAIYACGLFVSLL